mmetsp:Transcript_21824/g.49697  ORF Transcript_21824/g.49697 Transcript_21824/m.49697 type:complete len:114 (+) Transcript_21824:67-408(+)
MGAKSSRRQDGPLYVETDGPGRLKVQHCVTDDGTYIARGTDTRNDGKVRVKRGCTTIRFAASNQDAHRMVEEAYTEVCGPGSNDPMSSNAELVAEYAYECAQGRQQPSMRPFL